MDKNMQIKKNYAKHIIFKKHKIIIFFNRRNLKNILLLQIFSQTF